MLKVDDKFDMFLDFISPEECAKIMDAEMGNIIKFKTNRNGYEDLIKNISEYNLSKQRSMYCSQVSKLACMILGPDYNTYRGKVLLENNIPLSHTVIRSKRGVYYDFTLSQFESVGFRNFNFSEFKLIGEGLIDGYYSVRFKKNRSQELEYKFPSHNCLKVGLELSKKYDCLYYLRYYNDMHEELKGKIK